MKASSLLFCATIALLAAEIALCAEPEQARGKAVFAYWCESCHGVGADKPGTVALQAKYSGAVPAPLVERAGLTAELIAFYVRNGIGPMAPFRKTEIDDADLAALGAYLSRAR